MGEVYRARDPRLHRDVALKILPDPFALDSDRLARFEREAQVLASLNHPNIAAIYGIEEAQHVHGLVLELVDLHCPPAIGSWPRRSGSTATVTQWTSTRRRRFSSPTCPVTRRTSSCGHYEVSSDNQRFLVNTRKEVTAPITVILNWKPD